MARFLLLLGAVVVMTTAPQPVAAQIECVEKCVRLFPGFGCQPGEQGEHCTATVGYCMIDNCDPGGGGGGEEPQGFRTIDGLLQFAIVPCSGTPIVSAATAVRVSLPEASQPVARRNPPPTVSAKSADL